MHCGLHRITYILVAASGMGLRSEESKWESSVGVWTVSVWQRLEREEKNATLLGKQVEAGVREK